MFSKQNEKSNEKEWEWTVSVTVIKLPISVTAVQESAQEMVLNMGKCEFRLTSG